MPFKEGVQRLGGKARAAERWKDKAPETLRNKKISLNVSPGEYDMIKAKAKEMDISVTQLIIMACERFSP